MGLAHGPVPYPGWASRGPMPVPIRHDLAWGRPQPWSVTPEQEHSQRLLAAARKDYAGFYLIASQEEAVLLDRLVLAKAAADSMAIGLRQHLAPEFRRHFEKTGDAVDQLFAHARDQLRASAAFGRLPEEERARMEEWLTTNA